MGNLDKGNAENSQRNKSGELNSTRHSIPKFASFVTDFDLTLTKVCSAPTLYDEVCRTFPERRTVCDKLSQEFMEFMQGPPTSVGFAKWCDILACKETEMNRKIQESKVFEGVSFNSVTFPMSLQDGVARVLNFLSEQDIERQVVSLCWHKPLIQKTVGSSWKVASNTLLAEDGRLNGNFDWNVPTGLSKVEEMKSLPRPLVYVGDSLSDIPALKFADIGFFLRPKPSALRAAEEFDLDLKTLNDDELATEPGIYVISSWDQIAVSLGI